MAGNPRLIILSEQLRGKRFELDKDVLTVGRTEESDICIKDSTVSTLHCRFIRNGKTFVLQDNDSTNGTRVNNVPTKEQELHSTDIVQIGSVELLYDCEDEGVVMRTVTGIVIDDGTDVGTTTMKRIENIPTRTAEKGKRLTQTMMIGMVVLLTAIIISLLIYISILMLGGERQTGPAATAVTPAADAAGSPAAARKAKREKTN